MDSNGIKTIIDQLAAHIDDSVALAANQKWARERALALREHKKSPAFTDRTRPVAQRYAELYSLAGGKGWYKLLDGRSLADVDVLVEKKHSAAVNARNAKVAVALTNAGVTAVTGSDWIRTQDGFNGYFNVDTNTGPRAVSVRAIGAGGYNIQCWHTRVLVNVR